MKAWTVIGYAYKADIYCPTCITAEVLEADPNLDPDDYAVDSQGLAAGSTESILNAIAEGYGLLDNEYHELDEATYDSGDFPKVVFADQDEGEHCSRCHEALIEHDCPSECYGASE